MNQLKKAKPEPGFENTQNVSKKLIISRGMTKISGYWTVLIIKGGFADKINPSEKRGRKGVDLLMKIVELQKNETPECSTSFS